LPKEKEKVVTLGMNQESYQTIEDYAKIHEIENIGRPKRRPYTGFATLL